jgi:hypothetical protein
MATPAARSEVAIFHAQGAARPVFGASQLKVNQFVKIIASTIPEGVFDVEACRWREGR